LLAFQTGKPRRHLRIGTHRPDGTLVWLSVNAQPMVSDGESGPYAVVYTFRDITGHRLAKRYDKFRSQTLELLSGGASLQEVLEGIVRGMEQLNPGMICSILLLDSQGKHFDKGIAPSLPDFFTAPTDGMGIGVGVGSCGTAAATGERVIVDDIMTHPYWVPYKELAARAGLGACWSEPIRSSTAQVLGTFAVYHREARSPTAFDITLIEKSAHLASIAIEHKRMEQNIATREQEFRNLAETSPDFIIRYDREGRHLYLNDKLLKHLSLASAQEVIGKRPGEVWTDGRFAELEQAVARAVESGSQVSIEIIEPSETGASRYYQLVVVPERDVTGHIVGTITFGRDITALRENERKLRHFIENLPGLAYTLRRRPDGHVSFPYASPAIEEFYGLKPEDVKDDMMPINMLTHPEDRPRIMAAMAEAERMMAPFHIETRVCRPGLPQRWLDVRSAPEKQPDGSILWHGIMLDITERKESERQLKQALEFSQGVINAIPDLLFEMDREGTYLNVWAQNTELLAAQKEVLLGKTVSDVLAPDAAEIALSAIREADEKGMSFGKIYRIDLPVGESWFELSVSKKPGNDVPGHFILLSRDITERKRSEAELERHRQHLEQLVEDRTHALSIAKETAEAATRAKSRFLAAASHDLRQPISAIGLYNDALALSGLSEGQNKMSHNLTKSVDSLCEMLNELLDIAKLDAGKLVPQPVVIQSEELLVTLASEFDSVAQEKHLSFNLFCPRRNLALFTDKNLLLTILRNLIGNAVKYTKQGGILVSIRQRDKRALIQVWDTGIGIAPEQLDLIFEEFFQAGNSERNRAKGAGLGLAIVKRVSEALGNRVSCRSRLGRGSVFEISLPLAQEPDEQIMPVQICATHMVSAFGCLAGKRIVVIEDDAMAATALKLLLETHGMQVTHFSTAEDALGSTEAMEADHYISDYHLPGMNGLELLDAIQTKSAEPIKAVVLTGNISLNQIAITQSSRWKVLFKPVALPELLSAIEQ